MVRLWCQRKRTDLAKFSFGQNTIIGSSATRTLHKNTFFDPNTFFNDLVGVTKNSGSVAEKVGFKVAAAEAPYIITKPIHRSQQVVERLADGSVILEIKVVINHELERVFFGYAEGIQVLYPKTLVELMGRKLKRLLNNIPIQNEKGTRPIILSDIQEKQKSMESLSIVQLWRLVYSSSKALAHSYPS